MGVAMIKRPNLADCEVTITDTKQISKSVAEELPLFLLSGQSCSDWGDGHASETT